VTTKFSPNPRHAFTNGSSEPICEQLQRDARGELTVLHFYLVTCLSCLDRAITYHREMLDALVAHKMTLGQG